MNADREDRAGPGDALDSYVSPLLLSRLAEATPIEAPEARELPAAVAAIDVEGFSTLAESLSRRGPAGIEELASLIDTCFGSLVDAVHDQGGIAHTFPGDAVIAVWPTNGALGLGDATQLAARCAQQLTTRRARDVLPLKAAVGAGVITLAHVGGFADRFELVVTGEALSQLGPATQLARRGEVVLSGAAWEQLRGKASADERDGCFVLESMRGEVKAPPPSRATVVPAERRRLVRSYLPDGLLAQVDSGQLEWLAEFRRLSVLFALMSPRGRGPSFDPELLQRGFHRVQRALHRHRVGVVQICHDDKGVVVLAATGLPGMTHEDDAERAVRASLAIHRELDDLGIDSRIGVATGPTFCGALGNRNRREYSVVGAVVNLAARLMEDSEPGVLCDEATRAAGAPSLAFEERRRRELKGFPRAVSVFRATAPPAPETAGHGARVERRRADAHRAPIVGREKEQARIATWLENLAQGGKSVLAIRGEAGIGKSLLGAQLVSRAREAGLEVVRGFCDTFAPTAAYRPWRPILEQVLQLRGIADPEARRAHALEQVRSASLPDALAPLLGSPLALEIPESPLTHGMVGTVRSENTRALLAGLVRAAAERHRDRGSALLIVLEDAHWMDAASWELLDRVRRGAAELPLGIALTLRPVPDFEVAEACLGDAETTVVDLELLSEEATRELVRRRLGADEVEPELARLIFRRSEGNPFFCEELVAALREVGRVLQVEGGIARLAQEGASAAGVVPGSVSGVLASRIDRLPAELQLTLKTASVIGPRLEAQLLRAIHPVAPGSDAIEQQLEELARLDLLRIDGQDHYSFKHAITRDVAYNRLLFAQRRQLHRALAEHLEMGPDGVAPEILFHHWRESGEVAKALDYVDATGANAMLQGNYQHAIELFEYGLGSCADGEADAGEAIPRPVRWSHWLGEAQVAIGRHAVGRHNLEVGLQGLGHPVPAGRMRLAAATARELVVQLAHRALPRRAIRSGRTPGVWLVTASEAYEQLGYIHYASGETLLGIHDALCMLNLSERAAVSPVLARSYAAMALTVSVSPLRRLGPLYENAARWAAGELDDPLTGAYVDWISSLRAVGEARWKDVESGAGGALEPAARLADWRLQTMSLATLASGALLQGDFARAEELSYAQLAIAKEQGNRLWEAWALNGLCEAQRVEGNEEATLARCERALDILAEESDRNEEIRSNGMRAAALLRLGRTDEALSSARRTADLIASTDLTSFTPYAGFSYLCEVMLTLAEETRARGAVMPPTLRRDAQRSFAALKRFARVFPIGRPRCGHMRARLLRLHGRKKPAARALERAIADAERLGMPHEQGLALLALARCEWLAAARRSEALDRAVALLPSGVHQDQARQLRTELAG